MRVVDAHEEPFAGIGLNDLRVGDVISIEIETFTRTQRFLRVKRENYTITSSFAQDIFEPIP